MEQNNLLESTTYQNGAVILNKYNADQLQTEILKTNSTTTWLQNTYEYNKISKLPK